MRELHKEEMTISDLIDQFKKQVDICIPHYQEICWIRLMQDTDFARLPNDFLLIFTDFAAVMALRAFQAKKSSVDAHAVNDNFVCVYNRRNENVKKKKKKSDINVVQDEFESIGIYNVDIHYFLQRPSQKERRMIMPCIMSRWML